MTMADNTIYDLLDEVNCADSCEAVTALCELIDELLKDILHLELDALSQSKIWDTVTMTARHISCLKNFCMTAGILWNFATILSRYKKPVKANGPVGINTSLKRSRSGEC